MPVKRIIPVELGKMKISIICNEADADAATSRVMSAMNAHGWTKGAAPRVLVAQEVADMQIRKARMRARV